MCIGVEACVKRILASLHAVFVFLHVPTREAFVATETSSPTKRLAWLCDIGAHPLTNVCPIILLSWASEAINQRLLHPSNQNLMRDARVLGLSSVYLCICLTVDVCLWF